MQYEKDEQTLKKKMEMFQRLDSIVLKRYLACDLAMKYSRNSRISKRSGRLWSRSARRGRLYRSIWAGVMRRPRGWWPRLRGSRGSCSGPKICIFRPGMLWGGVKPFRDPVGFRSRRVSLLVIGLLKISVLHRQHYLSAINPQNSTQPATFQMIWDYKLHRLYLLSRRAWEN